MNAIQKTKLSNREWTELYKFAAEQLMPEVLSVVLLRCEQRHWSKERIRTLFDDICILYDFPTLYNKRVTADEIKEHIEKKYDIDFTRLTSKIHIEVEK